MSDEIGGGRAGIGGMVWNKGEVQIRSEDKENKKRKNKERSEQKEEEKQEERKRIRIIFWNVAGIGNKDEDFWRYIRNYDIVNLSETSTEAKNWKRIEKWLPKEFRWEMQGAYKEKKRGRIAGRMLTGIRKTLRVKNVEKEKRDMINMKIEIEEENWRIISVYNRMGKKDYLKSLEEEIERGGWRKIIIGGDFNARTAELGSITWNENGNEEEEEEKRRSKDKTLNRQGKDLIEEIEELGLGIMNGNKRGDEEGEMTYVGRNGNSVIDYAICNVEAWDEVRNMKVGNRAESDHRPIEITMGKKIERRNKRREESREVEDWTEEGCKKYQQKLKERKEQARGAKEEWEELAREIRRATTKKEIKVRENTLGKRKWWDRECRESKTKLNRIFREILKGKKEKASYLEEKRRHAKLCKGKEEEEKKKEQKKLLEIKDRNEVLKYIKRERQQRKQVNEDIKEEEWSGQFKKLLEGDKAGKTQAEIMKNGREWEKETEGELIIAEQEIERAIYRLKKKKAAREDGIRNEAWLNADKKTKGKLKSIIQKVCNGEEIPEGWKEKKIYIQISHYFI